MFVRSLVLLAGAVAAMCSSPPPANPYVSAGATLGGDGKGGGLGDGLATLPDGASGTVPDGVSVGGGDSGLLPDGGFGLLPDGAPIPGGPCVCTNFKCGSPSAACKNDCGKCGGGQVCIKGKCLDDSACLCKPGQCDVLPNCVDSCGTCPKNQLCDNNFCVPSCKCLGIECGAPPGCEKSCGECKDIAGPGTLCEKNECVADPLCACKPGTCGQPPGCPKDCGGCAPGLKCNKAFACVDAFDCSCDAIECGFAHPACPASCKACGTSKVCAGNVCIPQPACKVGEPCNRKYGEVCGPIAECVPPPPGSPQTGQIKYKACLDKQCESDHCQGGYCTKPCKIAKDAVDNASGKPGADGIEDQGVKSECDGAADGPNGAKFLCVEQASPFEVQSGSSSPFCAPGGAFKKCEANADCAKGEVCRLYFLNGDHEPRCGPKLHNPAGSAAAVGSAGCNENPAGAPPQPIMLCENNLCSGSGCLDLCKNDADCQTLAPQCKAGKCSSTGKTCIIDKDCPKWTCKAGQQVVPTSSSLFNVCFP
ncbi:MAG: hypothetical protein EXR79_11925 [Myxococcales bacterium]|nr:hypothetical protein [Myxococcales bacterium]